MGPSELCRGILPSARTSSQLETGAPGCGLMMCWTALWSASTLAQSCSLMAAGVLSDPVSSSCAGLMVGWRPGTSSTSSTVQLSSRKYLADLFIVCPCMSLVLICVLVISFETFSGCDPNSSGKDDGGVSLIHISQSLSSITR